MADVVDAGISSHPPVVFGLSGAARAAIPARDVVAGLLLIAATGLAVGGSFANLDRAVEHLPNGDTQVIVTSPWYYRSGPIQSLDLTQFFGAALVVGGVLALVTAALLLTGRTARFAMLRPAGAAAAAVLFGAILATELSVADDLQWDSLGTVGEHVTHPATGFWLLVAAGVAALAAVAFLVAGRSRPTVSRVEPETPSYGVSVIALPPEAPDPDHPKAVEHDQGPPAGIFG
jgi:hypothetical protein